MDSTAAIDPETTRRLVVHEARVHAMPGREVRVLADATILYDRRDDEPFWNRLVAPRWPTDQRAFDRRLDETVTLFATLGRMPHVWPLPIANEPHDLIGRLVAAGFESIGDGLIMILADPGAVLHGVHDLPGVTLERLVGLSRTTVRAAPDVARVLVEAFGVEPERLGPVEAETLASLDEPLVHFLLARVDGEPAAVAKRTTFDGASYLSSIGTRPRFRGRGLGRLVTAAVTADAHGNGSRWTYLGVHAENRTARRLYERLGFVVIGGPVPDLLFRA